MKYRNFVNLVVIVALVVTALSVTFAFGKVQAQTTLPTASTVASAMTVGWNLGNTLETRWSLRLSSTK